MPEPRGYEHSAHLAALRKLNRHLQPEGTLVFDVFLGLMEDAPLLIVDAVKRADSECRSR